MLEDYQKWAKPNKNYSLFSYIHSMSTQGYVKADFVVALFSFAWPEFRKVDDTVILAEEFFRENHYSKVHMNTHPISEMFPDLDFEVQKIIGEMVAEMWKSKLKLDFPNMKFVVECYEDEPEDLWCQFYHAKKT